MVFEFLKDVRYRIRIFDGDIGLMTAEAPDKGQRYITVVVHKDLFGLGEKTKLAFMLNPKIRPKVWGKKILEVDFDIRDATQLADLLDVCPDLVYEINEKYRDYVAEGENKVQNAQYKVLDNIIEKENEKEITEEEAEDYRTIDTLIRGTKAAGNGLKTIAPHTPILNRFIRLDDDKKEANIKKCLKLCKKHPKLLYWLPKHLEIEPEINALVSQSMVHQVGIQPSYYHAQTGALIAEKVLSRPQLKTGWEQVVMIVGVVGLIVLGIVLTLGFITGKI